MQVYALIAPIICTYMMLLRWLYYNDSAMQLTCATPVTKFNKQALALQGIDSCIKAPQALFVSNTKSKHPQALTFPKADNPPLYKSHSIQKPR